MILDDLVNEHKRGSDLESCIAKKYAQSCHLQPWIPPTGGMAGRMPEGCIGISLSLRLVLPWQWAWSSYRATAGEIPSPSWLTIDWVLGQFGQRVKSTQYRGEIGSDLVTCIAKRFAQSCHGSPWALPIGGMKGRKPGGSVGHRTLDTSSFSCSARNGQRSCWAVQPRAVSPLF